MSTITSKIIKLASLSIFLLIMNPGYLPAQDKARMIDAALKQSNCYQSLPGIYYAAVLPVQGCFSCEVLLNNQVKAIAGKYKMVIVYPSTRKIVQEKIIKENKLDPIFACYIFEDKLYRQLYDNKKPKGYIQQIKKK